jgi:hypothetical protein
MGHLLIVPSRGLNADIAGKKAYPVAHQGFSLLFAISYLRQVGLLLEQVKPSTALRRTRVQANTALAPSV